MPEAREYKATGPWAEDVALSISNGFEEARKNSISGASVGQAGMAHTPVFRPVCTGAPTHIVAPFGQQDSVRIQLIEVIA